MSDEKSNEKPDKKYSRRAKWYHIPNHKRAQPYQQNVHIHIPSPTAGGGVVKGGYVEKY